MLSLPQAAVVTALSILGTTLVAAPTASADGARWSDPTVIIGPNQRTSLLDMARGVDGAAALALVPNGYDVLTTTGGSTWTWISRLRTDDIGTPSSIAVARAGDSVAVAWCAQQEGVPFSEIFLRTIEDGQALTRKVADSTCSTRVSIAGTMVADGDFPSFVIAWGDRRADGTDELKTRTLWQSDWLDVETPWTEDAAAPSDLSSLKVVAAANGAAAIGFTVGYEVPGGLSYELRVATRGASRVNPQHRWSGSFAANSAFQISRGWDISMDPDDPTSVSAAWTSDSGLLPSIQFVRRTLAFGALLKSRQSLAGNGRAGASVAIDSTTERDIFSWLERSLSDDGYVVRSTAVLADETARTVQVTSGTSVGSEPEMDFTASVDNRMAIALSTQAARGAGDRVEVVQDTFTTLEGLWSGATTTTVGSAVPDTEVGPLSVFIPLSGPASLLWSTLNRAQDPFVTMLLSAGQILPEPPSRPTDVTAEAGDASAVVRWRAPVDTGTSPITGYLVSSTPDGLTCATAGARTCTVQGLTNGTRYVFNVTALSDDGASLPSLPSNVVTPASAAAPSAPRDVRAVGANRSATVSWTAPTSSGASRITSYTVTSTPEGKTCTTAGALTCVVSGLTNGTEYVFTVVATNATGPGLVSGFSNIAVPTTGRAPGAPTNVRATAGSASATVSWTAPRDSGTAPITEYIVQSTPDGQTCTAVRETRCTVSGLVNGESYTFAVVARSADGIGVPSTASNAVTPVDRLNLTVKARKRGKVVVKWTASTNPDVTSYKVRQRKNSGKWRTKDVGLVLKTTYTMRAGTKACYRVATVTAAGARGTWTPKKCVVAKR